MPSTVMHNHVARLMSERGLDNECDKHGTDYKKVMLDAERGSCDDYFACLFILVIQGLLKSLVPATICNQNKQTGKILVT